MRFVSLLFDLSPKMVHAFASRWQHTIENDWKVKTSTSHLHSAVYSNIIHRYCCFAVYHAINRFQIREYTQDARIPNVYRYVRHLWAWIECMFFFCIFILQMMIELPNIFLGVKALLVYLRYMLQARPTILPRFGCVCVCFHRTIPNSLYIDTYRRADRQAIRY